jgi:hypothetical protein
MKNKLQVEGHSNLYRDIKSGAIINENQTEYEKFMTQYEVKQKTKNKLSTIEKDLHNVKSEINEIKSLLLKLYERTSAE